MFTQLNRLLVNMNYEERYYLICAALINLKLTEEEKTTFLARLAGEVYEYNKFNKKGENGHGNTR